MELVMHDWGLRSVLFDWKTGRVTLSLRWDGSDKMLVARGVTDLHVPQLKDWGPSVHVNGVKGPTATIDGGQQILEIEMQTGDVIRIVAASFEIPNE
jgi:hypothetical protein